MQVGLHAQLAARFVPLDCCLGPLAPSSGKIIPVTVRKQNMRQIGSRLFKGVILYKYDNFITSVIFEWLILHFINLNLRCDLRI